MRKLLFIFLTIPLSFNGSSQDPLTLDSLITSYNYAKSDTQKINTLLELSDLYSTSDYEKSLEYAKEAIDISEQIDNKQFIAKSKLFVAYLFIISGDYDEALKNCLVSLEIYESQPANIELFNTYLVIGVIYDRIFEYDVALEYYFKALNISSDLKQKNDSLQTSLKVHTLYNNIGNIYETKDDDETAIEYYKKGLEIAKEKNDIPLLGIIYNNLGKIYDKLDKHDEAYKFLISSLEARMKINDKAGIAKSYYFLCAHFMDIKDYDEAKAYAEKSYDLGKEVGSLQTQHAAIWFLYHASNAMGQYKEAIEYYIEYKNIDDSLLNNKTINEITRLKMQYDFNAKEAEREMVLQKTKFKYTLTLAILILGLIILALSLIIIRYRANKVKLQRDNLEKDIELKNKELTTNVMYLVQKNEFINSITTRILKIKSNLKEENKEPIQKIIFELQNSMDSEVWEDFEYRFQHVHSEFYKNLQNNFPDLTPSETKLAALLRLNLSSKEIATLTGQSVDSVQVARYRLRKKLGISNKEVNLINFLSKF